MHCAQLSSAACAGNHSYRTLKYPPVRSYRRHPASPAMGILSVSVMVSMVQSRICTPGYYLLTGADGPSYSCHRFASARNAPVPVWITSIQSYRWHLTSWTPSTFFREGCSSRHRLVKDGQRVQKRHPAGKYPDGGLMPGIG